jgi:hypothetical protein
MRKIVLFFIFSSTILFVKAQTGVFVMSSIGAMPGTASNGLAINFNSIAACIDVQTGVAVLNGARGNGQFAINCEVTMKFNSLGIKMYPNPVKNILTISANSEIQRVSVRNILGQEVLTSNPRSNSATLQTSALQKGVYMVTTEIDGKLSTSKLIKE